MLPLWVKVDLRTMVMKGYSAFLEPHHQIFYCHIQETHGGDGLIPLQRSSRCILQPQLTGQIDGEVVSCYAKLKRQNSYEKSLFLDSLMCIFLNNLYIYIRICLYLFTFYAFPIQHKPKSYESPCLKNGF